MRKRIVMTGVLILVMALAIAVSSCDFDNEPAQSDASPTLTSPANAMW